MPKGTYLSNPSTAADGGLGGGSGNNPPYNPFQTIINAFSQVGKGLVAADKQVADFMTKTNNPAWLQPISNAVRPYVPEAFQNAAKSNLAPAPTNAFVNKTAQEAQSWQPAGLPNGVIPNSAAMQAGALDGMSNAQVEAQMKQAGFNQKWVEGMGMVWFPASGIGATANMGGLGGGDRPDYVNGAALAPGESVTDSSGNRFVGGTPTEDGTAQYAINIANPNAARDTKGKYKWVSSVKKDKDGNWVRVNRQVLRKVYTRSHIKAAAARYEEQQQQAAQNPVSQDPTVQNYNQLVNFRANYG